MESSSITPQHSRFLPPLSPCAFGDCINNHLLLLPKPLIQPRPPLFASPTSSAAESPNSGSPSAAMRLIVPLQGVVQGRGGLFWGTVIPCALFYALQLYIRFRRPPSPPLCPEEASSLPARETQANATAQHVRNPSRPAFISARAVAAVARVQESAYYAGWKEVVGNRYDAERNPEGVIHLGVAENVLSYDLLQEWLASHPEVSLWQETQHVTSKTQPLTLKTLAGYQDGRGLPALRLAMASFMAEVMGRGVTFDADRIVLTAGATAAIELLAFCLGDPGNAFLVPSPYYPGFDKDIKSRSGVELVPVHSRSSEGFSLTRMALERAFNQTQKRGMTVRALLVTSPNNPVGNLLSENTLRSVLSFTREKNIHLICDEIYAGSVYDGNFMSIAEIIASGEFDASHVHIIYGLSKDLGLAGFRLGVLYSYNDKVLTAAHHLVRFCSVSSPTQQLLSALLSDTGFVKRYLEENKKRLAKSCNTVVNLLQQVGISCAKCCGGIFCWIDLRHLLVSCNEEGELDLWKKLLYDVRIIVTAGGACHCSEPGWFRLCFASVSDQTLTVALKRLQQFAETCRR